MFIRLCEFGFYEPVSACQFIWVQYQTNRFMGLTGRTTEPSVHELSGRTIRSMSSAVEPPRSWV
ncbi:hypothetical protein TSUD_380460 [Trifolium subterraneum]|uniref:Uncharacterized protein n=1 Tax=Trifolium subterraneum TaxID=3900 RepID=A0A2Z6NDM0_TRISU|nr:hypothetical protein TSUD_380460 [Trifolium subterraneum]